MEFERTQKEVDEFGAPRRPSRQRPCGSRSGPFAPPSLTVGADPALPCSIRVR